MDTVGIFTGGEVYVSERVMGLAPFARSTSFALRDTLLIVGTGDEMEIRAYSMDGSLVKVARVAGVDLAVDQGDVEGFKAALLGTARSDDEQEFLGSLFDAWTFPETKPAYAELKVDEEGNIWLSLERRMKCGVGKCGHCQLNQIYTCLDGPVFSYSQIKHLEEAL